jgi:hypothetical protein
LFDAPFNARFTTLNNLPGELRRLWAEGRVMPQPVQRPIPIWMGYQNAKGARRAGLLGERLLSPRRELWQFYKEGLIEGRHDPAIGQMGGLIQGWVSDDPEADWPTISKHLAYQLDSYRRYGVEGTASPPPPPINVEKLRQKNVGAQMGAFMLATPEDAAQRIIEATIGAPVKHIYLWASIAGLPHDMAMRHINTIFTKLAPLLKAN